MSVEDVASFVKFGVWNTSSSSTTVLRDCVIRHRVDNLVLDLRRLHYDRLVFCFFILLAFIDTLQTRHVLCSIKLVRVDEIHFSW